jgi:DNA repair protein RadC
MENTIDIVKVCLVKDTTIEYANTQISGPQDLVDLGNKLIGNADREHFLLICFSTKHFINCIHTVSIGTLEASLVTAREVMKAAILSNSQGIAIMHNHPSGNPEPSRQDYETTEALQACARLFGIELLDHVIITGTENYTSMRSLGIIHN